MIRLATTIALIGLGTGSAIAEPAVTPAAVTITRDGFGVPHVSAADSRGVMFGLGYALAHDRLAQIELSRRGARGTKAELLGSAAIKGDIVARDRWLGDAELMRMYAAIPPEHQRMLQAVVDGINRHIDLVLADPAHLLPYEYKQWGITPTRWTLIDYLAIIAATPGGRGGYELENQAFLNAMRARYGEAVARTIFEDVVPISDPDSPLAIPPGEDLAPKRPIPVPGYYPPPPISLHGLADAGTVRAADEIVEASRCLVIGPKRSATGHVLMMEATSDGPESVLQGGGFDTAGFSATGWGPPIIGRGPGHGWLLTSGHADTTDLFAEKLDPADRYRYFYKGAWRAMAHHSETILVKNAPSVTHEVARTVHGPVVSFDADNGIAYAQSYAMRGHEIENWVGMVEVSRAHSLNDFVTKGVNRMAWNVGLCYGDDSGNFGFWEAGLFPKRAPGADPRLPMPGTGDYDWQGFLTPAERPHMLNPKQGYIHSWNSKAAPWMPEGDENRSGATFRTWLGNKLGASAHGLTLLDMRDFNRKIFSAFGAQDRSLTTPAFFAKYLLAAAATSADPEIKEAAARIVAFDGLYTDSDGDGRYDDPGLTLFREWLAVAPNLIFAPAIGDWWWKVDAGRYHQYRTSLLLRAVQGSDAGLPMKFDFFAGRNRNAVIVESLRQTIANVRRRFPDRPMADWRSATFWRYRDGSAPQPGKPHYPGGDSEGKSTTIALGLAPAVIPNNGGEGWAGMMEISPSVHALYSVTSLGGQDLFIDQAGHGNPHLTDQTVMHEHSDFKRIDMTPEVVARTASSVEHLTY